MKARFRVGCVPYVNARPLVACFDQPNEFVEVVYDVPSRLPALLDSGDVDAILVSSIEYLRRDDLVIAADVGIMSNGPVASVRMLSKVPLEEIQTLALDESSMTSNMLAQIILAERGIRPSLVTMEPDQAAMLAACDACVLIGDKGLEADGTGLVDVDLGAAWTELTGEGFTWALWLSRRDQFESPVWYERDPVEQLALLLQYGYESSGFAWLHEYMTVAGTRPLLCDGPGEDTWVRRDLELKVRSDSFEGRRNWTISQAASKSNWSESKTRDYLTQNVRFKLAWRDGLKTFATLLHKHGFLEKIVDHSRRREYSSSLIHSVYALNPGSQIKK